MEITQSAGMKYTVGTI